MPPNSAEKSTPANLPNTAMVLAAGKGTRMRPLTDERPKPLVCVGGRALLDGVLDKLCESGVRRAVVNVHHLADQIDAHLAGREDLDIAVSDERDALLETGGGIVRALPLIDSGTFFAVNSDSLWIDGARPLLHRLAETWDPDEMDILLAVAAATTASGYDGRGDFTMDGNGRLFRREQNRIAPFVYMGVSVLKASLFDDLKEERFSLSRMFDQAMEQERLFGLRHDGLWMHVGTPEAIAEAETAIANSID